MNFPVSTNIADNLIVTDKWSVIGSSITVSVIGGYLNVNPILVLPELTEYAYILGHYFNHKKLNYQFVYKKIDSTNSKLIIGLKSSNPSTQSSLFLVIKNVGETTFFYIKQSGYTNSEILLLACKAVLNDEILINVNFTSSVFNLGIKSPYQSTNVYSNGNYCVFNTSQFVLSPFLGSHQIKDLTISSDYSSRPEIRFIGDSITAGYPSWADYVGVRKNNYAIFAGQGDKTTEVISCLANINQFIAPVTVLLIGTNDAGFLRTADAFGADIKYIYDVLSTKSDVYICELLCRNDINVREFNKQLYKLLPIAKIIPTFPVLKQIGVDLYVPAYTYDGIHPTDEGSRILGTFVSSFLKVRGY